MKQFIVEMDEGKFCDYVRYHGNNEFCCTKIGHDAICNGDVNNRPEWCPMKEHDLSECYEKYNYECEKSFREATARLGW